MLKFRSIKRLLIVFLVITLIVSLSVGCKKTGKETKYEDGTYFAKEEQYSENSGYRYFVVVTVKDGKITDAYWGGTNIQPQGNKKTLSEEGTYGMVTYGGASAEWYKQAEAAEKWLVENQDPTKFDSLYTDDIGHTKSLTTDEGTQVSIHVKEFFELVKKALEEKAVAKGTYITPENYVVTSKLPVDEKGWEYKGEFIVVNDSIVAVNFNAIFKGELNEDTAKYFKTDAEGNADATKPLSKRELGDNYGMVAYGGAKSEWYEQADKTEEHIVKNQSLEINIDDDGKTDTISGVTINVNPFVELFKKAFVK